MRILIPSLLLFLLRTLLLLAVLHPLIQAGEADIAFEAKRFTAVDGSWLPYRIFRPARLDPQVKYPLVLALHGAGERGTDNLRQVGSIATAWTTPERQAKDPCFVIAPQCPEYIEQIPLGGTRMKLDPAATAKGEHLSIPVGTILPRGAKRWLVLRCAKDKKAEKMSMTISNLVISGEANAKPLHIRFAEKDLTPYAGLRSLAKEQYSQEIAADGSSITLASGNPGDIALKMPVTLTVGNDTVIEMDLKASGGRWYSLILDDDEEFLDQKWVMVPWDAKTSHQMPEKPSYAMGLALGLLDESMAGLPIDPERIYVVGLSMGGFGTWDLLMRRPQAIAGAVIMCGGAADDQAATIKHIPQWAFHGTADPFVRYSRSKTMIEALEKAGGKPKFTTLEGEGHMIWDGTMAKPEVLDWLMAQRRVQSR
jgi:predicted esterase